jgi:DNA-binding winged helix-turn-helix (wHTH) protein
MNGKWAPRHVALIDGLATRRARLCGRLAEGGGAPVVFEDSLELLSLLCGGRRFDLLLVVEDGTSMWHQLVTVCGVLGMPVLVLARKSGFEQGTQWLEKFPVSPLFDFAFEDCEDAELNQRISRLLHHGEAHQVQFSRIKETAFGNYKFDEAKGSVLHRESEIYLQPRQFQLALELFRNLGRVLERNRLWSLLWATPFPSKGVRTLDVCVANIRKRLQLSPENGFTLKSVYGRGYQLLAITPLKVSRPELDAATRIVVGWPANSVAPPDQASSAPPH